VLRLVAFAAVALVALATGSAGPAAPRGGTPLALVTAETLNQLLAVELPSGRIVRRFRMPADPENIETSAQSAIVVSPRAGAVTLLSIAPLRVVKVLRGFGAPHIALIPPFSSGRLAYVTDDARGQLVVIQLDRRRIVSRTFVGRGAHHMTVSPDGTRLWVALGERAQRIAVVDLKRPARPPLVGYVDPHGLAHDVSFSPTGKVVWVTYDDRSRVGIFSARTGKLLRTLPAGSPPQHVAFDQTSTARHAYVTSGNDGSLQVFAFRTGKLVRTYRTPYGSFNLGIYGGLLLIPSLYRGTLTELTGTGRIVLSKRVAPAARDAAVAVLP
jgi:hypothetical protein